ncbi:DUF2332 domain-containing protein [Ideonella sp.]|uniref:DUF2332 domain-containing protein n=1 Tax=Ideonella sp. TaxID=1929293 RepID=UPI0035B39106
MDAASLVPGFRAFAREHATEPVYAQLAAHMAEQPALGALLEAAPPTQRKTVLLFAAVHDRLLALAEAGRPLPALAEYFASVGGQRAPDEGLSAAWQSFVAEHAAALRDTVSSRATQTNEVGRCAVLWPALSAISLAHGGRPLALFDFGCSAGLNLCVDEMPVDWLAHTGERVLASAGPPPPAQPRLSCRLVDDRLPPVQPWRLVARLGTDPQPVDIDDAREVRWLRACLWPSETERVARFDAALALARRARHPVQRAEDGLAVLEAWLGTLPDGTVPVLFHSWVLFYFDAPALARHIDRVRALVRGRGLVWLAAEDAACSQAIAGEPAPARPGGAAGTPTWWTCTARGDGGEPATRWLACSHPHGRWMAWRG